jgi:hypothetical protein
VNELDDLQEAREQPGQEFTGLMAGPEMMKVKRADPVKACLQKIGEENEQRERDEAERCRELDEEARRRERPSRNIFD